MLNSERQTKVRKLCCDLVRTRSMSGEEQDVAGILEDFFRKHNFDSIEKDNTVISLAV